ncbi:MAG: hypothetical protein EPO62_00800 [Candidatus Nitrosotenuis sp.]|nr:MAG: hypothetical protein EPO62_00800 [Candidatus Nitrosotenuis sp.]
MNKMTGFFAFIAILSLLSSPALADSKITYKPKSTLKDIKNTTPEKTVKITKITKSRLLQVLYVVTIETCAGKNKLYSPELEMRSDKESLTVKISGLIMPNTCKTSEFFIRADNPDSISISFSAANSDLQRVPH